MMTGTVQPQTMQLQQLAQGLGLEQVPDLTLTYFLGGIEQGVEPFPSAELPLFLGQQAGQGFVVMSMYDVNDSSMVNWLDV